jgi:phenylacetate-CoA ligase
MDYIRVRLVPSPGYTGLDGQSIAERLRDRVGDIEIIVEPVDSIPRTKNGKFRAVISKIKLEENALMT